MSNSKTHMDREEAEDHSKIFEQQIFTRGVLGYCTHFEIPSNNRYNINFVHFQDFEALYYQEKLIHQNSKLILAEEKTDFDSPKKIAKAIENILVAKNNYQRIMLQMLDTIYHQEQQLKHHALLLELHNAVTSRADTYTKKLKDTIAYLTANQALAQTPPSSVPVHSSLYTSDAQNTKYLTDKLGNRDTAKTPRNTSERKKAPTPQPNTSNNIKKSSHGQRNNFSIDLASMPKQTSKKSSTSCFSQRLSNNKTFYQTPRTKSVSTSQQNSMCKNSGSLVDDGSKVVKKLSYFTRRVSDVCSSARLYEKQDPKTKNRENKSNNGKSQKKDKENIQKESRRYRNMSCNLSRRQSEENDMMSSMSKDFITTEMSEDDNKGKKLVSISSIQEDCNDHEYESIKINRAKTASNHNDKDEIIIVEDLSSKYIKEGAYRAPWIQNDKPGKISSEHQVSANNKSISFQSSSENHFHETENARMTVPDEPVLREVCNNKGKCEWPKEIFCTDSDQKYLEKPWDFLENNLVTSPSFGAQTMGIENRLSQNLGITDRRKSKGKVERKDSEQAILGKLYGGASLLKKKQWAPLFSTKKC